MLNPCCRRPPPGPRERGRQVESPPERSAHIQRRVRPQGDAVRGKSYKDIAVAAADMIKGHASAGDVKLSHSAIAKC